MSMLSYKKPHVKSILSFSTNSEESKAIVRLDPDLDLVFNKPIEHIKAFMLDKKFEGAILCVMSDGSLIGIEMQDGQLKTDSELWIHFRDNKMKNEEEYTCEKVILGWLSK